LEEQFPVAVIDMGGLKSLIAGDIVQKRQLSLIIGKCSARATCQECNQQSAERQYNDYQARRAGLNAILSHMPPLDKHDTIDARAA
jgi:hypothetical protein